MAEIAIDRGVTHEGHVIEALQRLQNLQADFFRGNFRLAGAFQPAGNARHGPLDPVTIDRSLAQRDLEGTHQLFAVERKLAAAFLDDHQLAQLHALIGRKAAAAIRADAPPADGGVVLRRTRVLDLCVFGTAEWAAHRLLSLHVGIHRETVRQADDLFTHRSLDGGIAFIRIGNLQTIENLDDQLADFAEFRFLETARRAGRRAETDTRGNEGLFRIERNAVLVAGDVSAAEGCFRTLACRVLLAKVNQHQVVVSAAGDDIEAAFDQGFSQRLGVLDDLCRIVLELRLQRFTEGNSLGGDDVHQRAALEAREDGGVELLRQILVVGEDHAAARAAQRLVRGGGRNMAMRERRGMLATGDETGDVRHIDHQVSANFISNFAEALPVPDTGIGGAASKNELRLMFLGLAFHFVHVEQVVAFAHAVGHDVEPLAGHVDRGTMRQVTTRVEVEAHKGVARLEQREKHGLVHLRTGVWLNVGEVDAEQLLCALDRELFSDVDELAAAVITFARITLGIFVGHDRTLRFKHGAGHDVFRGNQFDLVALATQFLLDRAENIRIGFGKRAGEESICVRHDEGS
ncbi:hypothetical protein AT6N2_C1164 [Agrobacterium tumefaciens]|nr:hypothetical protein AT6N2_C1164 [Agrobacterium tumefaciens]